MPSDSVSFQKSITGVSSSMLVKLSYSPWQTLHYFSKKPRLQIVPFVDNYTYKVIKRDDVISFADVASHTVPNVFDGIHILATARPLKILNPLLCKRICNNTCPMWTGIVVLKYGVLLDVLGNVDTQYAQGYRQCNVVLSKFV